VIPESMSQLRLRDGQCQFLVFAKAWPFPRKCCENFELLIFFKGEYILFKSFHDTSAVWPTYFLPISGQTNWYTPLAVVKF
jgi:hypothetical protein